MARQPEYSTIVDPIAKQEGLELSSPVYSFSIQSVNIQHSSPCPSSSPPTPPHPIPAHCTASPFHRVARPSQLPNSRPNFDAPPCRAIYFFSFWYLRYVIWVSSLIILVNSEDFDYEFRTLINFIFSDPDYFFSSLLTSLLVFLSYFPLLLALLFDIIFYISW